MPHVQRRYRPARITGINPKRHITIRPTQSIDRNMVNWPDFMNDFGFSDQSDQNDSSFQSQINHPSIRWHILLPSRCVPVNYYVSIHLHCWMRKGLEVTDEISISNALKESFMIRMIRLCWMKLDRIPVGIDKAL
jgi:hypothetical protein